MLCPFCFYKILNYSKRFHKKYKWVCGKDDEGRGLKARPSFITYHQLTGTFAFAGQ